MQIKNTKRLGAVLGDLKANLIKILDRIPKQDELDRSEPDEAETLKNKLQKCDDANELIELAVQTLNFVQKSHW